MRRTSQQQYGLEMSERPRVRSISVAAYPSSGVVNPKTGQRSQSDSVPTRKTSFVGRRVSLPNNFKKLPLRKKSSNKFKSIYENEPQIDPWDEIFMIYVSVFLWNSSLQSLHLVAGCLVVTQLAHNVVSTNVKWMLCGTLDRR